MPSSFEIHNKIKSFRMIQDVVSAMKAYAGMTIRRTEEAASNVTAYEENVYRAVADLRTHFPGLGVEEPGEGRRVVVAFGSSHGLCGPFNERVADAVSEEAGEADVVYVIGSRLKSMMDYKGTPYGGFRDSVVSMSGIPAAMEETVADLLGIYSDEGFIGLTIIFAYIADKRFKIASESVLPPDEERLAAFAPLNVPPVMYVDPALVVGSLIEELLFISIYRGYIESLRSENWSRMRSLEGATENLKNRIDELDSHMKYARQEEVTSEMIEVLSSGRFYRSKEE